MSDKTRTVEYSHTEWMKSIQYEDINGSGRLFGGRLMEWMDEVAGITAIRHSGANVTTAAVDNLTFKKGAFIDEIIVIIGRMTHVGRSSMEVRVDVYVEDRKTGNREAINRAFFTEVCVNEEGKPVPVEYQLELTTDTEKAEWEGARKRIEARRKRREEGY